MPNYFTYFSIFLNTKEDPFFAFFVKFLIFLIIFEKSPLYICEGAISPRAPLLMARFLLLPDNTLTFFLFIIRVEGTYLNKEKSRISPALESEVVN